MWFAKRETDWDHTSHIKWAAVTPHLGKRAGKYQPRDFHPYRKKPKTKLSNEQTRERLNMLFKAKAKVKHAGDKRPPSGASGNRSEPQYPVV